MSPHKILVPILMAALPITMSCSKEKELAPAPPTGQPAAGQGNGTITGKVTQEVEVKAGETVDVGFQIPSEKVACF